MANMPFKLSYSFEGNYRTRPEQNLSGASSKNTRELLIHRAHEERQKRQDQRLKLSSSVTIQAFVRSYLVRKRKKEEERHEFDSLQNVLQLRQLVARLLFFYDCKIDNERLFLTCHKVLDGRVEILQQMDSDVAMTWLIRRILCLCVNGLIHKKLFRICFDCIKVFTENANSSKRLEIWPYLVSKGLFREIRKILDSSSAEGNEILSLLQKPLELVPLMPSTKDSEIILYEFCNHFMCTPITLNIKCTLIPFLQKNSKFSYNEIIKFLNENRSYKMNSNLFYCVLSLEPNDFTPNKDSIQVLASLSKNLHQFFVSEFDIDDDSDVEEMEVSSDELTRQDYIHLLNQASRVTRLINFIVENSVNDEILISVVELCHNLLLIEKGSIRKFMLLFMLSLKGNFLNNLWNFIKKSESSFQINGMSLMQWKHIYTAISVFCDMFTFYTETLTDSDSSDTSATFTNSTLNSMSEMLKNVALNLIEIAFPMCRSTAVYPTPEITHLYNTCLKCVKILYTLDLRKNFCKANFWTQKKIHISQDLCRRNYLSKTICPFFGVVQEDEDEHLPPLSTIEQRSLAVLQQLPFLIEFNTRVLLLRDLCRYSIGNTEMRLRREFITHNSITVRRTHLYEDSFNKLASSNESDFKQKLRIQFINKVGLEEAGIDGGGIFKEFVNEVLKTSFDPNRGFFLLTNDNMLYPNPNVDVLVENFKDHYYFIGRLVGKALFETVLVDLPLAEFFLVKLLVDRADSHYLKSLDPVLYRNLLYLRDYSSDVQDLELDFTVNSNDLGETKVVELKSNGANIPVTNYNRLEYIHKLADYKLNTQIKQQCAAFRAGLDSVVPLLWLRLFNHVELQVIISGDTQEMDIEDLRAHTSYGGEFAADHPTVLLFWNIVQRFTDSQKKQLLKFVTSCSRPPLLGFKELNPQFCIHSSGTEDRMPTASTCLNLLKIPIIKDEEILRKKLLSAIEQQAGFELS